MFDSVLSSVIAATISGFVLGSLYTLMSVGLTLIWATSRFINWVHGALITVGAYIFWTLLTTQDLILALPLALVISFLIGTMIDFGIFRRLRALPNWDLNTIMVTIALALAVESLIPGIYGARPKSIPTIVEGSISLAGYPILNQTILIFAIANATMIFVALVLKYAKVGLAMRAISQDMDGARMVGIRIDRVYAYTLGLGTLLAALTGILLGALYFVTPTMGDTPLFIGFVVVIFGGLGNVQGSIYASYIVGVFQAFVNTFFSPFWALPALFVFLIVILLIRPSGLVKEQ